MRIEYCLVRAQIDGDNQTLTDPRGTCQATPPRTTPDTMGLEM